ncbi:MAG: hypothetical protein RI935_512 [Candidatus Parcubacteria bacterium]|jgi:hypothetical protein
MRIKMRGSGSRALEKILFHALIYLGIYGVDEWSTDLDEYPSQQSIPCSTFA